jgi:hypothetical protein
MWQRTEHDTTGDELFLAGEKVMPGIYRQIGGGREIRLDTEDFLPASLDGRVACYMRVRNTWAQMSSERNSASV